MTTVTGTVLRPAGSAVVGAKVIIDLVASTTDDQAPGYLPADQQEVWSRTITDTDEFGEWEADLPPTAIGDSAYTQNGLVYAVTYSFGGGEAVHYIDVPDSVTPLWVGSLLVSAPGDIPSGASGAPTSATYLIGSTNGTLSNAIVVGMNPSGQLGGTWPSPTVNSLHAGGSHATFQAAAEATAAAALLGHTGASSGAHAASAIAFTPQGSIAATNVQAAIQEVRDEAGGGGAPTTLDYLVGTATGSLSAEIVVGTSPGGELGGSWSSPTVDTTHSGSSHADATAAAEATSAAALTAHEAASDPHPGYLTPAEGNAAYDAIGAAAAEATLARNADNLTSGTVADARIASTIARDSETTAAIAALSSVYQPLDATLTSVAAYNTNGLLAQTAADTFAGRTITGTTNRLVVTNGDGVSGNPTLNVSTSYAGDTSITTLGTVSAGTWNAGIIPVAYGGTATASGLSPKDDITGTDATRNRCWEDFENTAASTTDGTPYGSTGRVYNALSGASSGTLASQWITDVVAPQLSIGSGGLTTGTTTTGKSGLTWLTAAYSFATADTLKFFARLRIPTLSDGTNTFVVRAGFMQVPNVVPTDGGFWFEANTGANWRCRVMDDSASTPDSDSTIVVNTVYVNFSIIYDGTNVHFYASTANANMTEVISASATGIPDVGTLLYPGISIIKSAGGTARTVIVDALGWDMPGPVRGMSQRI